MGTGILDHLDDLEENLFLGHVLGHKVLEKDCLLEEGQGAVRVLNLWTVCWKIWVEDIRKRKL